MLPTRIIMVPIWGTSILNLSHVQMWVPHLICHSLMILIGHLPHSKLLIKERQCICQLEDRIHCD